MVSAEKITEFLSSCPTPEAGCFASDSVALNSMLNMDDAVIRTDFQRAAEASTDAAIAGVPIEDATYMPAKLTAPGGGVFQGGDAEIGSSSTPRPVAEDGTNDISKMRQRIARCAYACGATAVGCPVRTPAEAEVTTPGSEENWPPIEYTVY